MLEEAAAKAPEAGADAITQLVEKAASGIEILAVTIIVVAIVIATAVYLGKVFTRKADIDTYRFYRHQVARSLLLGLEILVAGDVIRTVALEPTLRNVLMLGVLVLIRTFLGWSLVVEIEERWPWQPRRPEPGGREQSESRA